MPRKDADRDIALDAWEVEPLPVDFEAKVMAAWSDESARRDRAHRRRWWTTAVAAVMVCGLLSWTLSGNPGAEQSSVADERVAMGPDEVVVAPGIVARLERETKLQWSAAATGVEARLEMGRARFDVEPGHPLRVSTDAGVVRVTGTRFEMEMKAMSRNQAFMIGGATLAGTIALMVSVERGSVEVSNEHGVVPVAPGERAVSTDADAPRVVEPQRPDGDEDEQATPVANGPRVSRAEADRMRALIGAALERRKSTSKSGSEELPAASAPAKPDLPDGVLDKDYIRRTVSEDLVPLVRECYDSSLELQPELTGKMVLHFTIAGDESVGGIVEEVQLTDETTIADPAMRECVSESMMSVIFAPPADGGRVEVTYPIIFETQE